VVRCETASFLGFSAFSKRLEILGFSEFDSAMSPDAPKGITNYSAAKRLALVIPWMARSRCL
jgi:hypothetical protein